MGPADHLVEGVVATHVLAQAEQLAVLGEEARRVEAAGGLEAGLGGAQPLGQAGHEHGRDREVALDARRRDGDRLERALAADPARGRGVEVPLHAPRIELAGLDLDRVRREIGRGRRTHSRDPLGQAEPERELLVVPGRAHRHRDRTARDTDLERLLRSDAILLDRARRAAAPPRPRPSRREAARTLAGARGRKPGPTA